MVDVTINYTASDTCGTVVTTLSVTSNEPVNGLGDGDTSPDWEIVNNHLVRLRAERAGGGSGRIYTVTITATDASGQTTQAQLPDLKVRPPKTSRDARRRVAFGLRLH